MTQMTPRDKKAMTIGGVFIIFYVLFVFVVQPIYENQKAIELKQN